MKMIFGFLSGQNGIFTDNNEKDDYADAEDDSPIDFNINPTNRQTKAKKYKRASKKKSKSSHTINQAIKYQNNKKKKGKK